jgi:hypothetical protein
MSQISDIRYIYPERGMNGKIHYHHLDELEGWPEGTEIIVLEVKSAGHVVIQNRFGHRTELAHYCLNMGREYEIDGVWRRENHPIVLDHLERCLEHEIQTAYPTLAREQMERYKEMLEDILRTHGRTLRPQTLSEMQPA